MARILITWELGAGLGHLIPLQPIAAGLVERGHDVDLVVKDVCSAARVFDGVRCGVHQAPIKVGEPRFKKDPSRSLAHVLHNVGWEDLRELRALTGAWRHLYDSLRPDVIVFDHAPTAALASHGMDVRRVLLGTGFCCPPDHSPVRDLRPWMPDESETLLRDEREMRDRANALLEERGLPPLERLTEIYARTDRTILATFPELDHYLEQRGEAEYRGVWSLSSGDAPEWPPGEGRRVFAYVKRYRDLDFLLQTLAGLQTPTLIFAPRASADVRARFASPLVRIVDEPVDAMRACREADIVVHHGGHGLAAAALLGGAVSVIVPMHLEQTLTAMRMRDLGTATIALPNRRDQLAAALHSVFTSSGFHQRAEQLASRHADHDPVAAVGAAVDSIVEWE